MLDVGQVLDDPHVRERGVLHHWQHPQLGPVTQVKTPIAVDGQMPEIKTPAPAVGQDTRRILAELGYPPEAIKQMLASGVAAQTEPGGREKP